MLITFTYCLFVYCKSEKWETDISKKKNVISELFRTLRKMLCYTFNIYLTSVSGHLQTVTSVSHTMQLYLYFLATRIDIEETCETRQSSLTSKNRNIVNNAELIPGC